MFKLNKRLNANATKVVFGKRVREIHRKNVSNYYDLLGVTPNSTQGDIKQAYYKLSQEYHPDKPRGDEAKFREINSAYEVLGNLKLRKMYDKGLLPLGGLRPQPYQSQGGYENVHDATDSGEWWQQQNPGGGGSGPFAYGREGRRHHPNTGKTSAFDYDEWFRRHYSETFTRPRYGYGPGPRPRSTSSSGRYQWEDFDHRKMSNYSQQAQVERFVVAVITIICIYGLFESVCNNFDRPSRPRPLPPSKPKPIPTD